MKKHSYYITLAFAVLLGAFGIDRFYTGSVVLGFLKLITGGCGGVWWVIDVVLLVMGDYKDGDGKHVEGNGKDDKIEKRLGFALRIK
jgi:TM2 domain-containing membrane protein YozV